MRALITAMGSRGDVQPALALACALRAKGHEVIVSAASDFTAWAGELGLPFVSSGQNLQQWLQEHWDDVNGSPMQFLRALKQIATEMLPVWFESTLRSAEATDVIISANQFAAHTAAEKLGIPVVCVAYSPTLLRSAHHAPLFMPWQRLPRWMNSVLWSLSDRVIWGLARRYINAERRKLGLQPVDSVAKHLFEGVPYLLACDALFAPAPPDWSHFDVTVTGPWFYDDPMPLDPEVTAFLDAGSPPVYVGFGSMVSSDAARLTQSLLDGANGQRMLLSSGWAGIGGGHLPPSVKVVRGPMPHAKLFPRVAAVVHHGGAGTTAAALRAGVPQIIVPHLADQFYNAHRLAVMGLAPPGIPVKRLTAKRLQDALRMSLALPAAPRQAMAEHLLNSDGLACAVEVVERAAQR